VFEDVEFFESMEEKDRIKLIDCQLIFAIIWGIGASVVSEHRRNFDIFVKRLINGDVPEVKKGKKV
jgi:hypothetical protein